MGHEQKSAETCDFDLPLENLEDLFHSLSKSDVHQPLPKT